MTLITIDKETCTRCGLCTIPCRMIYMREGSYPRQLPGTDEFCMRCGHCVGICPTGALTHREMPLEETPLIDKSLRISFEQCAQLIKSRRSIREYRDEDVPDEVFEKIIDVARYAPTGHNFQEVQWLVVNNREKVRQIAAIGAQFLRDMMKSNPEMAQMFAGIIQQLDLGRDMFLQGAPAVVLTYAEAENLIARTDCVIAMSYFDLAATTIGLGCCWAGFMMMASVSYPDMVKVLGLPEGYSPFAALMVGYPQYRYTRIPARKPGQITWL